MMSLILRTVCIILSACDHLGAFPGRVTYVVGKDGAVKSVFDDLVNAALHPEKALATLS